jgi:hypothetical protein
VLLLAVSLGLSPGLAISLVLAASIVVTYVRLIGPRLGRWGATDEEVARPMPGDDLFPGAPTATRAITIDARPHDIWPWLVQLGYGRAGWYSYDWIDNDRKPSAERIVPEFQRLEPGDEILMIPGMGFSVREVETNHFILSTSGDTGTWCMELVPGDGARTRLISRWRDSWRARVTLANIFWIAITDPGSWFMEQKMLRGIKRRVEARVTKDDSPSHDSNSSGRKEVVSNLLLPSAAYSMRLHITGEGEREELLQLCRDNKRVRCRKLDRDHAARTHSYSSISPPGTSR